MAVNYECKRRFSKKQRSNLERWHTGALSVGSNIVPSVQRLEFSHSVSFPFYAFLSRTFQRLNYVMPERIKRMYVRRAFNPKSNQYAI